MNYLSHHGIKGQKWGIRNGPPYPLREDEHSKAELKRMADEDMQGALIENLDRFGKSKDSNALFISGISGSGKSTVALAMADKNTDVVHLDGYSEDKSDFHTVQNRRLNRYLTSIGFDISSIYMDDEKIKASDPSYWKNVDSFTEALLQFSKDEFDSGRKVIIEGVQIENGWLDSTYFNNMPHIVLYADKETARSRAAERDADQ